MTQTYTTQYGKVVAGNVLATDTVIISGGDLKAGSVLKSAVAEGKETFALASAAGDVSAILLEDCDATDGEKTATVLFSGEVNKDALVFEGSATAADYVALRKIGIFAKKCI